MAHDAPATSAAATASMSISQKRRAIQPPGFGCLSLNRVLQSYFRLHELPKGRMTAERSGRRRVIGGKSKIAEVEPGPYGTAYQGVSPRRACCLPPASRHRPHRLLGAIERT